jgi:DNA-directed RNA polymerase specialized sigma24 family protein
LSQSFSQNLEDKKNLSSDLILKLDTRLEYYRKLLSDTEASLERAINKLNEANKEGIRLSTLQNTVSDKANPAAPEVRALVLKLAKEGLTIEEIAVRTHLHRGEVELIIDLENQFTI